MTEWVSGQGVGARVVADSISVWGRRLTTIEATMHRFVLAELNTHRVFSRNSASSRAIPFHRMVARVKSYPAIPLVWASEQSGMQGGEEIPLDQTYHARRDWLAARDMAVSQAESLAARGVHKSIVNRLLEPFMWHTVIITSTEWDNFWNQRISPLAQPEIKAVATKMREVYDASEPTSVRDGDWHLPYVDEADIKEILERYGESAPENAKHISAARCARVSYLTHDGQRDMDKDLELFDRLVSADPMHASPLEHVATPLLPNAQALGNFVGWRQLRHDVELNRGGTDGR